MVEHGEKISHEVEGADTRNRLPSKLVSSRLQPLYEIYEEMSILEKHFKFSLKVYFSIREKIGNSTFSNPITESQCCAMVFQGSRISKKLKYLIVAIRFE